MLRTLGLKEGWIGPLFIPGDTASYLSLEARLRSNIPYYEEYLAFNDYLRTNEKSSPPSGGLAPFFDLMSGVAVTEIIKYLTGISVPHLAGKFLIINLLTWETEIHEVLRVPHLDTDTSLSPRPFPWKEVPHDGSQTRRA